MPQGPKGKRRPRDVIGNAVHLMRIAGVQSSRRLEREAGRNVEVMWLTGRRQDRALPASGTATSCTRSSSLSLMQDARNEIYPLEVRGGVGRGGFRRNKR